MTQSTRFETVVSFAERSPDLHFDDEQGFLTLPTDDLPRWARHGGARCDVEMTFSKEPSGVEGTVTDFGSRLETEIRCCGDWFELGGSRFVEGSLEEAPDWLTTDGDSGYVIIELDYDLAATLRRSTDTPKRLHVNAGVLDWTTPGARERWATPLETDRCRFAASAVADTVVVPTVRETVGLDVESGAQIWSRALSESEPASGGEADPQRTVYPSVERVHALDVDSGRTHWTYEVSDALETFPPRENGTLYVATSTGEVHAVDTETGRREWMKPFDGSISALALDVESDTLATAGPDGGTVTLLDARTGDRITSVSTTGVETPPVATTGSVVFPAGKHIRAVDTGSGEHSWTASVDDVVETRPAAGAGTVVVITLHGTIVAFDARDGTKEWMRTLPNGSARDVPPVIEDDTVYIVTKEETHGADTVRALDLETGTPSWRHEVPNMARSPFDVHDGTVFSPNEHITEDYGSVHALEPTGAVRRTYRGSVDSIDNAGSLRLSSSSSEDVGWVDLPVEALPYYGRFEGAAFDVFLALDESLSAVTGGRPRQSPTTFEYRAQESGDGVITLSGIGDEERQGRLSLNDEPIAPLDSSGDWSGYIALFLDYLEDETPAGAKPDPVELWNRYSG